MQDIFIKTQVSAAGFQALHAEDADSAASETAARLTRDFNEHLRQVMTDEEYEEMSIRSFEVSCFDVWKEARRFGSNLSPSELREALRILKPEQLIAPGPDNDWLKTISPSSPMQDAAKGQQLRALLGDERFGAFLQHHEGDFNQSPGWSDETKPLPTVFLQLFNIKESAMRQVGEIQQMQA